MLLKIFELKVCSMLKDSQVLQNELFHLDEKFPKILQRTEFEVIALSPPRTRSLSRAYVSDIERLSDRFGLMRSFQEVVVQV